MPILSAWIDYSIPRINDLINKLIGKKLFIKMDIRWSYNNVRIQEDDEWKAAFLCKFGLYIWTTGHVLWTYQLPCNLSIDDEQYISIWNSSRMVSDNILLSNKGNREDLTRKVITVLEKLQQHDLFVKPEKSEFFVTNVSFLGFKVEDGKLAMEQPKVSGITNWPPPETITQVKSFLCFCNFYQIFINHYANTYVLTTKQSFRENQTMEMEWRKTSCFQKFKSCFRLSTSVNNSKPFIIEADTSLCCLGLHYEPGS